jgi:hypothetical protein
MADSANAVVRKRHTDPFPARTAAFPQSPATNAEVSTAKRWKPQLDYAERTAFRAYSDAADPLTDIEQLGLPGK